MYYLRKGTVGLLRILFSMLFLLAPWQGIKADQVRARLLDGFSKGCKIVRCDGKAVEAVQMLALYEGDRVIQDAGVESIRIKCFPYVSLKQIDDRTVEIVCEPPAEKTGILKQVAEFLGLVAEEHRSLPAAARTLFWDEEIISPRPGYAATVIPKCPVLFSWDEDGGRYIVFTDSSGQELLRKVLHGATSIRLDPEEIRMESGQSCFWRIEGASPSELHSIRLLSENNSRQVLADLEKIDSEKAEPRQKNLKKGAYLQFMSDTYPANVDLYWMAYQFLIEIEPLKALTDDEKSAYSMLVERHVQHLKDTYYSINNREQP